MDRDMEKKLRSGRYQRNFDLLTGEDQLKLQSSTVAIVGCGGLGGFLAEELTRIGVGHLILIDGDVVEISNLNRQLFALEDNIGEPKVKAAKERLLKVNSQTVIDSYEQWFTEETGNSLLAGADLVCDALDTGKARLILENTCHDLGIPLVLAAIGGWYGLVGVSFPGDNIAVKLFGQDRQGIEKQLGNPAFTPAAIASLAVAEAVKVLIGKPASLHRSILYMDLLTMKFDRFSI
ncbi:HesA/MoeB/ThiF family protein [Dehalobacter sp. DCM]|uniref:HesA/MoeB/ThiF family protein n=1 Tax=Dehalobacter sp. DCM TaxID=2907827 RepID=UPI0030821056|nr:HesA/MoeB/ThiF family protein [Dehalobacter sp. DCM]